MLDLSAVQAISLDLDDTLWPVWPTIARAEQVLRAWLADRAPRTAACFADAPALQRLRAGVAAARPYLQHDLSAVRRELIRSALLQAEEDVELAEGAFDVFFAARQDVQLYEDALDALAFFAARMPVVALSNGNADVHRIGIGAHFHAAVSARESGWAKPDARIFQAAAAAAGVAPAAMLHVGDDPDLDVLGALDAGMQTAWVQRGQGDWPHPARGPHATVPDLRALCAMWGEAAG